MPHTPRLAALIPTNSRGARHTTHTWRQLVRLRQTDPRRCTRTHRLGGDDKKQAGAADNRRTQGTGTHQTPCLDQRSLSPRLSTKALPCLLRTRPASQPEHTHTPPARRRAMHWRTAATPPAGAPGRKDDEEEGTQEAATLGSSLRADGDAPQADTHTHVCGRRFEVGARSGHVHGSAPHRTPAESPPQQPPHGHSQTGSPTARALSRKRNR